MPRPKEFDREVALKKAVRVFCETGFEGTSTDDLLGAMGISRQSMYDTFGDKRSLYLEALRYYLAERIAIYIGRLSAEASALKGLEALLNAATVSEYGDGKSGSMLIRAVCEFGRRDAEIASLLDSAEQTFLLAVEHRIDDAKSKREIGGELNSRAAAEYIRAMIPAMRLAARGGASDQSLRNIARMALRSLR
jgi:TetR/AcrR family transcriptional regulator, transcriptional repressor for nem operon